MLDSYTRQWNLIPDGDPIVTRNARLLPVRAGGERAMLKIASEPEERCGSVIMEWWDGDGAARTNPDLDGPGRPLATGPEVFARRMEVVAEAAGLDRARLLHWILAWAGLSAAWYLADGESAAADFAVAELAAAALDR